MLSRFKFPLLLLFSYLFAGCPENETVDNPDGLDTDSTLIGIEDFQLFYRNGGGMSPESENIYISNDSASWKYGRYNKESQINWIPTTENISDLIKVLEKNNYLKIESREEEEVYDRGGVKMTVIHKNSKKELNNSGRTFINEQWSDEFGAINNYIKEYVQIEIDKQLLTVPLIKDIALNQNGEPVNVWLNDQQFFSTIDTSLKNPEKITVYPGINNFTWTIYYADSVKYNNEPVYKNGGQSIFTVDQETSEIILKKENQEIKLIVR